MHKLPTSSPTIPLFVAFHPLPTLPKHLSSLLWLFHFTTLSSTTGNVYERQSYIICTQFYTYKLYNKFDTHIQFKSCTLYIDAIHM